MENGHPSLGLEDGTIDVEDLLVEPQDGHLSMDSVICFDDKIPKNAMDIEHVSRSSGGSDTGLAQEGKDVLNGEVLNVRSEAEVGYFLLENDYCNMGDEYLLGVEFAESITNLDYGSSEGLQASASDCQNQVSTDGSDTGCRSDLYRTGDLRKCQNNHISVGSSKFGDTPSRRECETLDGENPTISPRSCTLQTSGKSRNSSSSSFSDVLSNENDGRYSHDEMFFSPKTKRNDDIELTGQNGATNVVEEQETLATTSVQASRQKRSRKPTQRYIDGLVDPIPTHTKRRREVSTSTIKDKSHGVKDHRKCHVGPKAIKVPPEDPEEFSVIAIQVPFGSIANKECSESQARDMVQHVDCSNSTTKSKGKYVTLNNQNKMEKCVTAVDPKKRGDCGTGQKKTDGCVTEAPPKKKDGHANQKKRNDFTMTAIRKKRDVCLTTERQNKRDDYRSAVHRKKRDDTLTAESTEEASGRRKHHRLWTISEVKKLIEGVSQYGVGRWSRIKKLFFSASAHRTSVDLKDKWRNLLKASGMQEQGSQQQGEKKRNLAWRPLPKSILRRVCELAAVHPYPKGERAKDDALALVRRDSPDRSTDITLSDYKRILRSINGN